MRRFQILAVIGLSFVAFGLGKRLYSVRESSVKPERPTLDGSGDMTFPPVTLPAPRHPPAAPPSQETSVVPTERQAITRTQGSVKMEVRCANPYGLTVRAELDGRRSGILFMRWQRDIYHYDHGMEMNPLDGRGISFEAIVRTPPDLSVTQLVFVNGRRIESNGLRHDEPDNGVGAVKSWERYPVDLDADSLRWIEACFRQRR